MIGDLNIPEADWTVKNLDGTTPQKLQEEAWYTFVYHFGNRGREGIKDLKKQDFEFPFDSDGKEFCELVSSVEQKCHSGLFGKCQMCSYLQHREGKLSTAVYKTVSFQN